jgi:2-succinyl-6-hydroxy-2,4-cyclohexadiene-1-carboxylate synthase
MSRIDLGDTWLEVRIGGVGSSILALHGFTGSAATWNGLAGALGDGRRLIAPDLLGHAGSDAPPDPARYAMERQADDLAALLDVLAAAPADVVGYSMGARLALVLALRHPAAVRRLILESPSAGIGDERARAARRAADEVLAVRLERDGVVAFVDAWEAQPVFASQRALPEEVRDRQRAERLGHDPAGLAASLRGAGQGAMTPLHARLAEISCPTLVIAGALDVVGLERARFVAASLPAGTLEVVTGAGHAVHLEQAEIFLRLVREHLAATPFPVQ